MIDTKRIAYATIILLILALLLLASVPKTSIVDTAISIFTTPTPTLRHAKPISAYPGPTEFIDPYPGPPTLYPTLTPILPTTTPWPYETPYWTPVPRPTIPWGNK